MYRRLMINVALLYAILVVVNLPAPWLVLSFDQGVSGARLPAGVVGAYSALRTGQGGGPQWPQADRELALFCASYAYYTLGLTRLTGVTSLLSRHHGLFP
jgi:hypothetical protein